MRAGGEGKYISPIIEATGDHALRDKPLTEIDQIAIDNAANALYPGAPSTTTNRQFYTPVSAVLKRAGIEREIKRPKGWRGSKSTEWLEPEQAFPLIDTAYAIEPEFGLFCLTLLYTGMRLSDPIRARLRDLKLGEALLYVPDTKNGEPRPVHLPPVVVQAFRDQPARTGSAPQGRPAYRWRTVPQASRGATLACRSSIAARMKSYSGFISAAGSAKCWPLP